MAPSSQTRRLAFGEGSQVRFFALGSPVPHPIITEVARWGGSVFGRTKPPSGGGRGEIRPGFGGRLPGPDGAVAPTLQAAGDGEGNAAVRTGGPDLEYVKGRPAFGAGPESARRRRHPAGRARQTVTPRRSCDAHKAQCVSQSVPAVQENEHGHNAEPG